MRIGHFLMISIVIVYGILGCPDTTQAQESTLCPICLKANDEAAGYVEKAGNTLARGVLNTGLGWTELIRQPAKEAKEGGDLLGGLANGVGQSVARTFSGLAEILTFWTPKTQSGYIHFAEDCPLDTNK